ncbi:DDE-type integrase/transposase/recombinase [Patescibacteria group bacterium]|nr:DDE-type integrase/transposase/recombinase [Patescibacteria group bacterium]
MSTTIREERLRWVLPIVNKEIKLVDAAKVCPYSKRSLERWVSVYRKVGESGLEPKSTEPKRYHNETSIAVKEQVIALRKKTSLCAQKLNWRLNKEGVKVPVRTIGKIIKKEGLVRTYRKKKVRCTYIKAQRKPGELLEIDVKHVPGPIAGHKYYQYTAIDTASRWRYLKIYDEQSSYHSILFLKEVMNRFPSKIDAIKTDNHSTFTNYYTGTNKRSDMTVKRIHALDRFCAKHHIVHYLIDPGKPAQNGTVERSHREDQEKVYSRYTFNSVLSLKRRIRRWNNEYNDLEHCGLDGKTPNEMLELFKSARRG